MNITKHFRMVIHARDPTDHKDLKTKNKETTY